MEYIEYDFPNYLKLIDQEIDKKTYLRRSTDKFKLSFNKGKIF